MTPYSQLKILVLFNNSCSGVLRYLASNSGLSV